jgi:hypothetical protein
MLISFLERNETVNPTRAFGGSISIGGVRWIRRKKKEEE